jgi:hypothetical protein
MVRVLGPVATLAFATGCAGVAGVAPPSSAMPAQSLAHEQSVFAQRPVSPETCDKGARVRIRARGGAFSVPQCAGWNGVIKYPTTGKARWLVTSSVTNNFGVPAPPSGTAIFYMQTTLNHPEGPQDFSDTGVSDTVASSQLTSNHTYTLMVYNLPYNDQCPSGWCGPWILNIGSPEAGKHSITFSSPLNGATVLPGADAAPVCGNLFETNQSL